MRNIEAQLHDILLDLFPDQYNNQNQAKIVAEAADIFQNNKSKRTSSTANGETSYVRALWAAMASLGIDEEYDEYEDNYVDGVGLNPEQIIRSAVNKNNKYNLKLRKMSMEILNDDDVDIFLDKENVNEYNFDDATDEERHPLANFVSPGKPKHHTDSRVTPG